MTSHRPRRIQVAKIATAHGVRGLVKLKMMGDDPSLLETVPVFIGETSAQTLKLTLKNPLGANWVAVVEGVHERNAAEALRGTGLWIDRDTLPEIGADEYYAADLIGMTALGEDGADVGVIVAVENFGASPLLEIKPAGQPSFYLPFTSETVIGEDLDARVITVRLPEGLL